MPVNMIYQNEFRIDFIGIGASKSGTTWIAEVLRKHPGIYFPTKRKEVNYFSKYLAQDYHTKNLDYEKPYSWYHNFFKDAKPGQLVGEITPSYLSMDNSSTDIHNYNPGIKIFAVLRNPVERSYSEYLFSRQNGVNSYKDFKEAIDSNPAKFIKSSMYYENMARYYQFFQAENIKIFFYEDLKKDNKAFLKELYNFLQVDEFYYEGFDTTVNRGQQAKSQKLNNFIGKTKMFIHSKNLHFLIPAMEKTGILKIIKSVKRKNLTSRISKETIKPELKNELINYFIKDIEHLETLTGKNLSHWKI